MSESIGKVGLGSISCGGWERDPTKSAGETHRDEERWTELLVRTAVLYIFTMTTP